MLLLLVAQAPDQPIPENTVKDCSFSLVRGGPPPSASSFHRYAAILATSLSPLSVRFHCNFLQADLRVEELFITKSTDFVLFDTFVLLFLPSHTIELGYS
uniref:Uncharacterized protein n=1 Tax=Ditylenchus dipsaci TaxID=166011 RepID=A0A915DBQ4_9BILA